MNRTTWLAAPLVFASGLCALIYQVAWTRELRFVFGASTAASSAVIAIFIAGLGFGGLWFGARVERSARPLLYYAKLEVGIALASALTPLLLELVRAVYGWSGGSLRLGVAGSSAVRLLLATLVLGPPTWLMGGTLPAMARAVESESDPARRAVAWIYGLNTLGAVAGATLSTFVLLERFGIRASLWSAGVLNLGVAGAAWLASRRLERAPQPSAAAGKSPADPEPSVGAEPSAGPLAPRAWIYASAAVVGFAFFLMELVWYRMLGPLLGGTVFTFGLILAVALAGIGVGSSLYAAVFSRRRGLLIGFAFTCALEGLCLAVPYALGDRIAIWALLLRPLGSMGFEGFVFGWAAIALIVIFPASVVAGAQFPMLISLLGSGRTRVARDVGTAYAANTLGAIAGALAGGFGLLPALGALGCWRLACGLLAGWGALIAGVAIARKLARFQTAWVFGASSATVVLLVAALGPTAAWRHSPIGAGRVQPQTIHSPNALHTFLNQGRRSIPWETDGIESSIAIDRYDAIGLIVNGKSDGNARADAPTQVMGALVGAALMPQVERAMVIGLGTGSTAGWLARVPEIERVDVAEIEPAILGVAKACELVNEFALDNPKLHIYRGDARELLAVSRERYDLIFSEPSNPYRAGVASLYTREFYEAIRERLAEGGLFVQWLQAYDVDEETMRSVYATLHEVFPHVETWDGMRHDLLLVASDHEPVHDTEALRARISQEPFIRAMRISWQTDTLEGFLSHYLANPAFARAAANSGAPINTDDRTPVEFGFARNLRGAGHAGNDMFESTRAAGQHRPALRGGSVDWDRVDYEREAFSLVSAGLPPSFRLAPHYRGRFEILSRWTSGDFRGALETWNAVGSQSGDLQLILLERHAIAELFAHLGADETEPWIVSLTPEQPTVTLALQAVWSSRHGRREEATERMLRALQQYRVDPWPPPGVMSRAFNLMRIQAPNDRELAPRWLEALANPFAVYVNESARERSLLAIALGLGPEHPACLTALGALEPYPEWNEDMLEFRVKCYTAHGKPLADRARAELAEYRRNAPVPFAKLLPPVP